MSNVRKSIVSNCEKAFLIKNLSESTRLDGRAFDEFRKVDIEFGKDWGCCCVSLGKTRVLAQVSCEIQQPKSSRPSEGILNIHIELNPIAAPHFESNRQSNLSIQLNRLLEKCLKDSKAIDLESLCIKMNQRVWAIRVDINVLSHEGNILDCSSIAALAALAHFRRPDVTCDGEEFIIHTYKQRDPIPMVIHHYPVCITYSVFSGGLYILADPTLLEEGVADAFLSVGLNSYKELCGLHLGGKADLSPAVILATANKAASRASIVVQMIKDAIEENNKKRQSREDHGFHKMKTAEDIEAPSADVNIFDSWSRKSRKKQRSLKKHSKGPQPVVENESNFTANVESLGAGTAALVPNEKDGAGANSWQTSESEEDDDNEVMVVDVPEPVVETVAIGDTDSEEDAVVVLNAKQKSKKKKKLKTT